MPTDEILQRKRIRQITGKSDPTIWRWCKNGTFPRPVPLGGGTVGWLKSEVEAWIEARKAARAEIQNSNENP